MAHEFALLIAKAWNTGMTPGFYFVFSLYQFISHKFTHLNINLIGLNNQMKKPTALLPFLDSFLLLWSPSPANFHDLSSPWDILVGIMNNKTSVALEKKST